MAINNPARAIERMSATSPRPFRIEICGGIASGKTTLAHLLSGTYISPLLEDFQSNPFWKPFYLDPIGNAFETEITFLLQHYHAIKYATKEEVNSVSDFSLILDLAYAHVTLSGSKLRAFTTVHSEITQQLGKPDLLVHLICDSSTELKRVIQRGRDAEHSISSEYLEKLNQSLNNMIDTHAKSWNLLRINSSVINFFNDEKGKEDVKRQIVDAVSLL